MLHPALNATPIAVLTERITALSVPINTALFLSGVTAMYITVDSDQQRVQFRLANGNMKVWNEDPFFITAKYRRKNGEVGTNLLLGEYVTKSISGKDY